MKKFMELQRKIPETVFIEKNNLRTLVVGFWNGKSRCSCLLKSQHQYYEEKYE